MTGWYAERTPGRSAKAVIAVTLLALLLVAAVPVALLAGVMMMLGHVIGGLALFSGSLFAAATAVILAGMSGMRHLRRLVSGQIFHVMQQDGGQHTVQEATGSDYADVVRLDRSEYTEVR